jgi:hypothetical protein
MEVSGQLHVLAVLSPKERAPGTHWIGGWMGPKAVLKAVVKKKIPSPRQESIPRTFFSVNNIGYEYTRLLDLTTDLATHN